MNDQLLLTLALSMLRQYGNHEVTRMEATLHVPVAAVLARQAALTSTQQKQLRRLMTDYEWMLAQKIAVIAGVGAEPDEVAVRFHQARLTIAKSWLAMPNLETEYIEHPQPDGRINLHLQLRLNYGSHGLVDILDFGVTKHTAKQLQTKQLDLLTWAESALADVAHE